MDYIEDDTDYFESFPRVYIQDTLQTMDKPTMDKQPMDKQTMDKRQRKRLTCDNVFDYIGKTIQFTMGRKKSEKIILEKIILGVSTTGKTIKIDHPDLQNNLEIVKRSVYVLI